MKNFFCMPALILALLFIYPGYSAAAETAPRPTPAILEDIANLLSVFNYDDAVALFDTIDPADAASSQIRLLKASVLNSAGKTQEARAIAEDITAKEPDNLDALFVMSAIEGASGRQKEQRAVLEKIISIDSGNIDALTQLGNLNLQTRAISSASDNYDKILEIDPENLDALLGKATIYRLNRDPQNAEAMLNKAVMAHPNEAAPYHERARLYKGAGFAVQALADLDKAKDLDDQDYWIAMDRADTLLFLNRKPQALEEYERAEALNPDDYLAYAYTAGIKDDLGDYDGAEKDYDTLSRLKPDYYFAFEGVGIHKMRRGLWAQARDAFAETYRQAPNDYYYALLAAVCWMRSDTIAAPRQFLNQAMTKVKRDTIEYYMLRLYYDLSGRVYNGENDMLARVDRETDNDTKARMLFYLAQYYDIRGNQNLANKFFMQFRDMGRQSLPEWRLNEWICTDRGLIAF
ncbi:MAG: tetratricopeptide repeat protein [Treponema sp.]|nr:tetratricopeptide repeat protein [Treponema sp.]